MGNCLALEKAQQVLDDFPGHAVADESPATMAAGYLDSTTARMRRGRLCYLVPPEEKKKPATTGVIRVKVVLTKQQVKEMVSKGEVSHGDMMCLLRRAQRTGGEGEKEKGVEWRPTLESIPEGND